MTFVILFYVTTGAPKLFHKRSLMSNYSIALELPPLIKQDLSLLCNGLLHMNWTEHFQIILFHLGSLPESKLAEIKERLADLSALPFQINLQGISSTHTKSYYQLWAHPFPSDPILRLKHKIDLALMNVKNLPPQEKGFKPRVLLGEAEQINSHKLADYLAYHSFYKSAPFMVEHFALVSTHATPKRVLQENIEKYPLIQSQ
jgi:2'-5' RNA ligase